MKAIRVHTPGGPEALRLDELSLPEPGAGQVRVKIEAAGVNFIDTYKRAGVYRVEVPFTTGEEAGGVIDAVGSEVTGLAPGDRVAYANVQGAYAEYALVPSAKLAAVPEGLGTKEAAALMLQGMTAHYLTRSAVPLQEGDFCLVHAAAGGVGLLLVQMASRMGAVVIATAGSEAKRRLAREAGAKQVLPYAGFSKAVQEFTSGQGVRVVYDGVGRATYEGSLDSLAVRGTLVLFGQASGPVPPLDPQILNRKGSLFLTRPSLGHYTSNPVEFAQRSSEVLSWAAAGELMVRIGLELPLEQAAEAHRRLEARETTGKVLLLP